MSLIDNFMTPCCFMEKHRIKDGAGGFSTVWKEGEGFNAAITIDTSIEAKKAEQEGMTSIYTITTDQRVFLEYQDVIKRLEDGAYFRVTTDGKEKKTPRVSTLNLTQVTAERYKLP